jgi:hypothetical protein
MPWGRLRVPPNFPRWVAHPVPQSLRGAPGGGYEEWPAV